MWLMLGMVLCQICVGCGKETVNGSGVWGQLLGIPACERRVEFVTEVEAPHPPTATALPEATLEPELVWSPADSAEPEETPSPTAEPTATQPAITTEAPEVTKTPATTQVSIATAVPQAPTVTTAPTVTQAPVATAAPAPTQAPPATQAPAATTKPQAHTHTIATKTREATCLRDGVTKEYCESCGEILREQEIPALGHDFVKSVWELPTCMKGGYYNNVCSRCGQVECVTQEPLPHEVEDILVQEGNCMEDTVIQHICKVCGMKVKEDTRYTLYDVHSWTSMEIDGEEITYCERCGVAK